MSPGEEAVPHLHLSALLLAFKALLQQVLCAYTCKRGEGAPGSFFVPILLKGISSMSLTSSSCPRCGLTSLAPIPTCASCGWSFVTPPIAAREPPAQEQKRRLSRRMVLLGLAASAGVLALGSGGWIWYLNARRPQLLTYTGHQGVQITALAWSPDGNAIASGDAQGTIHLWDPATGATRLTCQRAAAQRVMSLSWSPESPSVLAGYTNRLVIWDATSGKPTFTTTRLTGPAAYSTLGNYKPCYLAYSFLLAACQDQQAVVVFPASSLTTPLASIDSGGIRALAFAPVEEMRDLAFVPAASSTQPVVYGAVIPSTCGQNGPANTTLSYERGDVGGPLPGGVGELSTPWGSGGGFLIGGSLPSGVVYQGVWGSYEMDHPAAVVAAALCPAQQSLPADAHPDGWYTVIGYIATADSEGSVRIWGNDQKHLLAMRTHQPVLQLAWSPDGKFLAVVTADGTVQVWKANLSSLPALWRNTSFN
jgi:hypothetical protein